jgi:hypothetical protein
MEFQFENLKGRGFGRELGGVNMILKYALNKQIWIEIAFSGSMI